MALETMKWGENELKQRNQVVARGGIEPPTHGFSIRCSTD